MESQSPLVQELTGLLPWITGIGGAIVAGVGFAFATGRKAQVFVQNGVDIAALRAELREAEAKRVADTAERRNEWNTAEEKRQRQFERLMEAIELIGRADVRREAEVEGLRRDVDTLTDRVNAA